MQNINVQIDDKDQVLLLLYSLPNTHDHFRGLYGRETFSLKKVQATLSLKELNEKFDVKAFGVEDGLVARDRSSTSDNKEGRKRLKSRVRNDGNR